MSWSITTNATTGNVTGSSVERVKANETVTISAGDNIAITQNGHTISVALMRDINLNSVTANVINTKDLTATGNVTLGGGAGTSVKIAENTTVDMGGNRIQNVANATIDSDAVNYAQWKELSERINNMSGGSPEAVKGLSNRMDQLDKRLAKSDRNSRAGIAGANAAASLPQSSLPGKSMVAAAGGTFKGQNAFAVGYSRTSDNGKMVIKLQGNANTQGDFGGGVGIGYQW